MNANAQITLEHTYATSLSGPIEVVNLSNDGIKYAEYYGCSKVILYNTNHTVWKTINFPVIPNCGCSYDPSGDNTFISENLFNNDNLVELAISYITTSTPYQSTLVIFNEVGIIIDSISNAQGISVHDVGNNTFKAIVGVYSGGYSVYSLPGTIPCSICGGGLGVAKLTNNSNGGDLANPIPNPNSGVVKLGYTLPLGVTQGTITVYNTNGQAIKTYQVTNTFEYIIIDNAELPSGIYYYTLTASNMLPTVKKMVVIK